MTRPRVNSESQKELDKMEKSFQVFDQQVQDLTLDRMNEAPLLEAEPQTKMSTREANKKDAPYMKPVRSINSKEPFDENYRKQHTEAWKYIKCTVENYEIIGEMVECWTKAFAGDPAHFWKIPVNTPVYIPKLLAEQLSECKYHRLHMEESKSTGSDGMGTYVGAMVVDHTKQRIDCRPVGFGFVSMGM